MDLRFCLVVLIFCITFLRTHSYEDYDDVENDYFGGCEESGNCMDNSIDEECGHQTKFSEGELEAVRRYLITRFAKTRPNKPPCKKLHVRKNWKCLSKKEIIDFARVVKALYDNGVMDTMSLIHGTYWPFIHKFAEVVPWHRWHVNKYEQEMQKINPNVTLPYWDYLEDFAAPEQSSIWETFGTSGGKHEGYCVPDGAFAHQRVRFPKKGCVKRQWNMNHTIPVWEPPEWVTSITQTQKGYDTWAVLLGNAAHFKTHLHVGGYKGDMSDYFSTNDPIFYPYHAHVADLAFLKWQLSDDSHLVPLTYDRAMRYDWRVDMALAADIQSDTLTFYEETPVKEAFEHGHGELCYIHDVLVKPILDIMRNKKPNGVPKGVQNLRKALPPKVFARYFPKFAANTATEFDHFLPDGHKSAKHNYLSGYCNELPVALSYGSTDNGRRFLHVMRTAANTDTTPMVLGAEQEYYDFMAVLKRYHYCSPYV